MCMMMFGKDGSLPAAVSDTQKLDRAMYLGLGGYWVYHKDPKILDEPSRLG